MADNGFNQEKLKTTPLPGEEFSNVGKTAPVREFGEFNKIKKASKIVSITLTIVGAGVVLGSIVEYSFIYRPTAVIEKFEVTADDNNVYYDIVVRDMQPETLTLKLYNQFTNREEVIIMGENKGSFTELAKGMDYTVSIIEKDILVKKTRIVTKYIAPVEE